MGQDNIRAQKKALTVNDLEVIRAGIIGIIHLNFNIRVSPIMGLTVGHIVHATRHEANGAVWFKVNATALHGNGDKVVPFIIIPADQYLVVKKWVKLLEAHYKSLSMVYTDRSPLVPSMGPHLNKLKFFTSTSQFARPYNQLLQSIDPVLASKIS